MYVTVAVFDAKDPSKGVFTYFTDKALAPGTLVTIPFGSKQTTGIVIAKQAQTTLKTVLPILQVPLPVPLLLPKQLDLMHAVADYYAVSLSQTLSLALPQFPLSLFRQVDIVQTPRRFFQPQTLMLAPSTALLVRLTDQLARKNKTNRFIHYHGEQSPKERFAAYQSVYRGDARIIIATRSGLFLPFRNLQQIFIYKEHDWSYKESRTPAYHAVTVAQILAHQQHASLTIKDNTPRVQSAYTFAKATNPSYHLRAATHVPAQTTIAIVDLQAEQKRGNDRLLSEQLKKALKQALDHNLPIIFYLNKRNDGGMVFCDDCKKSSYVQTKPVVCPNCKSRRFKSVIANIRAIAAELNRLLLLWGYSKGTWHADPQGSLFTWPTMAFPAITIATQKIFYTPTDARFGLAAVVLADTLLNMPEFRAQEKTFATLADLRALLRPNGTLFIQTRQPNHPIFSAVWANHYKAFVKQELAERKQRKYPPFALLVLLRFTARTKATVEKHARKLHVALTDIAADDQTNSVEIVGPFPSLLSELQVRILLKGSTRADLTAYLAAVPANWKVDFDPETIVI